MKIIQRNPDTGYFQVKDKDGILCWIPGEFEKLYERLMTCKAKADTNRKKADYYKDLVDNLRSEVKQWQGLCEANKFGQELKDEEFEELEHRLKVWQVLSITSWIMSIGCLLLFLFEVNK